MATWFRLSRLELSPYLYQYTVVITILTDLLVLVFTTLLAV